MALSWFEYEADEKADHPFVVVPGHWYRISAPALVRMEAPVWLTTLAAFVRRLAEQCFPRWSHRGRRFSGI